MVSKRKGGRGKGRRKGGKGREREGGKGGGREGGKGKREVEEEKSRVLFDRHNEQYSPS